MSNIPIYFDHEHNVYFYPKVCFNETADCRHPVIRSPIHLIYDFTTNWHYDPYTDEQYVSIKTSQDFKNLQAAPSITQIQMYQHNPIFFDTETEHYFYPELGVCDPGPIVYINAPLPLHQKEFYNPNTLHKYAQLTKEQFEKRKKQSTCVFCSGWLFYYPQVLVEGEVLIPKKVIKGDPPTGVAYISLKKPMELLEKRLKYRQEVLKKRNAILGRIFP